MVTVDYSALANQARNSASTPPNDPRLSSVLEEGIAAIQRMCCKDKVPLVLVIDPSPALAQGISSYIRDSGWLAIHASDASRALEILKNHPVDAILLDCEMSVLAGVTDLEGKISKIQPGVQVTHMTSCKNNVCESIRLRPISHQFDEQLSDWLRGLKVA